MNIPTTTKASRRKVGGSLPPRWRSLVWPPCHHARYRRAGGQNIAAIAAFRLKKFIPRLRPVDCRFSWRGIYLYAEKAERLL